MKTKTKQYLLYISMILVAVNSMTQPLNLQKYIPDQILTFKLLEFPIMFIASIIVLWGIIWIKDNKV